MLTDKQFERVLLAIGGAFAALYLWRGLSAPGNWENDSAYYIMMAQRVLDGHLDEPLVWNYLRDRREILHAGFDYWPPGTSLALAGLMLVTGRDLAGGLLAAALISAASVIVFAGLVARSGLIKTRGLQVLAVVVYALCPLLAVYRFDTESLSLTMLLSTSALWAWVERRWALTAALAAGLVWVRGDAVFLMVLLLGAVALDAKRNGRLKRVALGAGVVLVALAGLYTWLHGAPYPPSASLAYKARHLGDFYVAGVAPEATFAPWTWEHIKPRLMFGTLGWVILTVLPAGVLWLPLGMLAGHGWGGRVSAEISERPALRHVVWLAAFVVPVMVAMFGPPAVFNASRVYATAVPFAVLASAMGAERLLAWLQVKTDRSWVPTVGVAALAIASAVPLLRAPDYLRWPARSPILAPLTELDTQMNGAPVLSTAPFAVARDTSSPVAMYPDDSEAIVGRVIETYDIRFVVLRRAGHEWMRSRALVDEMLSGQRTHLSGIELTRIAETEAVVVFELQR